MSKPLTHEEMRALAGTQLGTCECEGCGAELPVKVNKAGCVYTFCARVIGTQPDGKPEKCMTRSNLGRTASATVIQQWKETQGEENGPLEQSETREEGRIEQPAEPEPTSGGFGAALKHFLTE